MNEQLSFGGYGAGPARSREDLTAQLHNAAITEETAINLMTQIRRDLLSEIDWKLEHGVPRRGPSAAEAVLALGSMITGALVTAAAMSTSTTVVTGFLGMQSANHWDALPFVLIVWATVLAVNLVWARRR